jgi:membrane protein involved in colicin uptake
MAVSQIKRTGGMTSEDKVLGLQNVVQTIGRLVESVAGDKTQADTVKKLAQISGNLANEVKGFAQRVAQQKKAQAGAEGDGGKAAELQAKITGTVLAAKVKAANARESHAEKTAQRQAQHELQTQQRAQDHAQTMRERQDQHSLDLQEKAEQHALEIAAERAKAEIEVKRAAAKPAPTSDES